MCGVSKEIEREGIWVEECIVLYAPASRGESEIRRYHFGMRQPAVGRALSLKTLVSRWTFIITTKLPHERSILEENRKWQGFKNILDLTDIGRSKRKKSSRGNLNWRSSSFSMPTQVFKLYAVNVLVA